MFVFVAAFAAGSCDRARGRRVFLMRSGDCSTNLCRKSLITISIDELLFLAWRYLIYSTTIDIHDIDCERVKIFNKVSHEMRWRKPLQAALRDIWIEKTLRNVLLNFRWNKINRVPSNSENYSVCIFKDIFRKSIANNFSCCWIILHFKHKFLSLWIFFSCLSLPPPTHSLAFHVVLKVSFHFAFWIEMLIERHE